MKERPIIFSGASVTAILAGRKSQTRRLVKPPPTAGHYLRTCWIAAPNGFEMGIRWLWREVGPNGRAIPNDERRCPYGIPGGRLWVREAFYCDHFEYPNGDREEMLEMLSYRAGHDCRDWEGGCPCPKDGSPSWWRSPLHMPRWASRIMLEITDVRTEQLHDISEDDARAEGVKASDAGIVFGPAEQGGEAIVHPELARTYRGAYAIAWDLINGKRAPWASNPWVWVVSFNVVEVERA